MNTQANAERDILPQLHSNHHQPPRPPGQTPAASIHAAPGTLEPVAPPAKIRTERSGIPDRPFADFGRRMAEAVRDARVADTQEGLGKVLGYAQVTVGAWLRGDKVPSVDKGIKIAKKLGVTLEWLYCGTGPKYPVPSHPVMQLATELAKAPPRVQNLIRALLDQAMRDELAD